MAKITLENGMVLEGTPEELVELAKGFNEEGKPVVEDPKGDTLKVGDYAKVVNADYRTMHGFRNGDIVEIIRGPYGDDDVDYRVKKVNGTITGYVAKTGRYVVEATEEEIAKVTAIKAEIEAKETQRKLEAKWSKIGRKVNEYKVGDVVRVVNAGTSYLEVGDIGEIYEFSPSGSSARVNARGLTSANWLGAVGRFELITPVEARFDR